MPCGKTGNPTPATSGGDLRAVQVLVRGAVVALGQRRALARLALAGGRTAACDAAVEGTATVDPVAAEQAALDYLATHGATGTVTVTADAITVTVSSTAHLQLLTLVGADTASFTATATVDVVKVDLP